MLLAAGAIALAFHLGQGSEKSASGNVQVAANDKPIQRAPQAPGIGGRMQLQGQYPGPLNNTVIQRWKDPVDGTVCYIYLPIIVPHSAPLPNGLVQYGPNTIGSISCMPGH